MVNTISRRHARNRSCGVQVCRFSFPFSSAVGPCALLKGVRRNAQPTDEEACSTRTWRFLVQPEAVVDLAILVDRANLKAAGVGVDQQRT